jgi:hypothetical protein
MLSGITNTQKNSSKGQNDRGWALCLCDMKTRDFHYPLLHWSWSIVSGYVMIRMWYIVTLLSCYPAT